MLVRIQCLRHHTPVHGRVEIVDDVASRQTLHTLRQGAPQRELEEPLVHTGPHVVHRLLEGRIRRVNLQILPEELVFVDNLLRINGVGEPSVQGASPLAAEQVFPRLDDPPMGAHVRDLARADQRQLDAADGN